ncbi:tektin-4 [Drosophila grimshawi]|uniref:Tektin n=1 Tax=Drosophila grimshawi TaxID=7222 RepID=B4JED5_DROGR|nr:tektin-4 [Drosophila grimshawi]EDW03655.1 GH10383 [Drosophila grimshawi]
MACCKEKDLYAGGGDCINDTIELHPKSACPAPLICAPPPEMGPIRRRKYEPSPVGIVPPTDEEQREIQEYVKKVTGEPAQEHHQMVTDLQADVDNQQQQLLDIQQEQAQRPLKTEELQFARSIDPDADNLQNPPCYLPQPGDDLPHKDSMTPMGPIGPWATGRVDWSPMAGLTGTRPVVDRYSITRYSSNEWRAKNEQTVQYVNSVLDKADKNRFSSTTEYQRLTAMVNKTQNETTDKLRQRSQVICKWKSTLETAIRTMTDEVFMIDEERNRLRRTLVVLGVPESIVKECIEKRCGRPDSELVRDHTEEELVNELALIAEIKRVLKKTLDDFNAQQMENRAAKQRLEFDWSDKQEAYDIDTVNLGLSNTSRMIMFHVGAMRQPPEQSSEKYWEHFSLETLDECEKCRQRSAALRSTLNAILLNGARDLRTQADIVEKSFMSRINCTQEAVKRYENDLHRVLQDLADTETRIEQIQGRIRSFDAAMKVAQTRMYNRSFRPNVESCRDVAQQRLIDEVHTIQSSVTAMLQELKSAEETKDALVGVRGALEREIMLKRRTLFVDRERCMLLRSHYPSTDALSGAGEF